MLEINRDTSVNETVAASSFDLLVYELQEKSLPEIFITGRRRMTSTKAEITGSFKHS